MKKLLGIVTLLAFGLVVIPDVPIFAEKRKTKRSRTSSKKPSVLKLYKDAQKHFKAGRFEKAASVLSLNLKHYPGHVPSLTLYARCLYHMKRIQEALPFFAGLDPKTLDADSSYEYGLTHYRAEQYSPAMIAFKQVPKNHSLYDLANYYGGVCAIRLRRYDEAEQLLDRAVVLPNKLARSKKVFLVHLGKIRILRERRRLADQRKKERDMIKQSRRPKPPPPPPPVPQPLEKGPQPYEHFSFGEIYEKRAELGYTLIEQETDFHGFARQPTTIREGFFEFRTGLLFPFTDRGHRRTTFGLPIRLKVANRDVTGVEQRLTIPSATRNVLRLKLTEIEQLEQNADATLRPFIDIPFGKSYWFGAALETFFLFPEYASVNGSNSQELILRVGETKILYDYMVGITYFLSSLASGDAQSSRVRVMGRTRVRPTADLEITSELIHDQIEYTKEDLNGPDASTRFSVELEYFLPFTTEFHAKTTIDNQVNHLTYGLPVYDVVAADGQVYSGEVGLELRPFPWIRGMILKKWELANFRPSREEATEVYEKNVKDFIDEVSYTIALNLYF